MADRAIQNASEEEVVEITERPKHSGRVYEVLVVTERDLAPETLEMIDAILAEAFELYQTGFVYYKHLFVRLNHPDTSLPDIIFTIEPDADQLICDVLTQLKLNPRLKNIPTISYAPSEMAQEEAPEEKPVVLESLFPPLRPKS